MSRPQGVLSITRRRVNRVLALFYCCHIPESSDRDRQKIEEKYGNSLRLFPMPCSGRIEPLHLLRALEEFADAAYVITCPAGECCYFEGNLWAKKRVQWTQELISSIGLDPERIGVAMNSKENPRSLFEVAYDIMESIAHLGPSPVFNECQSQAMESET
jgi:F420-non-reducing hydrogenase iron-sulfur subunit